MGTLLTNTLEPGTLMPLTCRGAKSPGGDESILIMTDSTIAPPQSQRFSSTNVSLQLDTWEGAMKKTSSHVVLFAKDYRLMTSGWQGAPYFRRHDRESAGFKTGDFVQEQLGGATVERLLFQRRVVGRG